MNPLPPALLPMTRVLCDVGTLVTLGPAKYGERRYVPLAGGRVEGPELNGRILEGGIDWQTLRDDGVLDIAAHYVIATDDGALIEVHSEGMRHGPPGVMAALARGESPPADSYYFRTRMLFATSAPAWAHLNKVLALASGRREARQVLLDVWRVA
jgi:hypothetical protein